MKHTRFYLIAFALLIQLPSFALAQTNASETEADTLRGRSASGYVTAAEEVSPVYSAPYALSAEAGALMQYADVPVSLYTGIPDIAIPLHTVRVGQFQLPVALRYHASGIKVAQEASRVGLGWSLQAGGVISRIVRDKDDLRFPAVHPDSALSRLASLNADEPRAFDCEADIFIYNFGAYSGRFYLQRKDGSTDIQQALLATPEQNLRVRYEDGTFYVTSPENITYEFAAQETTQHFWAQGALGGKADLINGTKQGSDAPTMESLRSIIPTAYSTDYESITSWYLTRITLPSGEQITLNYDMLHAAYLSPVRRSEKRVQVLNTTSWSKTNPNASFRVKDTERIDIDLQKTQPVLSAIRWDGGQILFVPDESPRRDVRRNPNDANADTSRALRQVRVLNSLNQPVANYHLNYGYFGPSGTSADSTSLALRLKLLSVSQVAGSDSLTYRLAYNEEDVLPLKNCPQTDRWGYYAGHTSADIPFETFKSSERIYAVKSAGTDAKGNLIYTCNTSKPLLVPGQKKQLSGVSEIPSANAKAATWTLTELTTPLQGRTVFSYEPNEVQADEDFSAEPDVRATQTVQKYPLDESVEKTIAAVSGCNYALLQCTYQATQLPTLILDEPIITPNPLPGTEPADTTITDYYKAEQGRTLLSATSGALTTTVVGIPETAAYSSVNNIDTYTFTVTVPLTEGSPLQLSLTPLSGVAMQVVVQMCAGSADGTRQYVGGLRVRQIASPVSVRRYEYLNDEGRSSGVLTRRPRFSDYKTAVQGPGYRYTQYIEYSSTPCLSMENPFTGQHIGYSKVSVLQSDSNEVHRDDYYYHNESEGVLSSSSVDNVFPLNGRMHRHITYANGREVAADSVQYRINEHPALLVPSFSVSALRPYRIALQFCPIVRSESLLRGTLASDTTAIRTVRTFAYDILNKQVSRIVTHTHGEPDRKQEITYSIDRRPATFVLPDGTPLESSDTSLYSRYCDANLVCLPVAERFYVGDKLQKHTEYAYGDVPMALPERVFDFYNRPGVQFPQADGTLPNGARAEQTIIYNHKGRPVCRQSRMGQETISLWGYNNQYVVAEISGTTLEALQQAGIDVDNLAESPDPTTTLSWQRLQALNTYIPDALVALSEYKPLVGQTKTVSPAGLTTKYLYDGFGRLVEIREVRGADEFVIKKYTYEYGRTQ